MSWLRLVVPREAVTAPHLAAQLYAALHAGLPRRGTVQLLLMGTAGDVGIWLRAAAPTPLTALVRATYPDAQVLSVAPPLPGPVPADGLAGTRWRLAQEAAFPVKTARPHAPFEPMALLLGALAEARAGESAALSVVITPAPASFARRSAALAHAVATGADTRPGWQRAAAAPVELVADLLQAVATLAPAAGPAPARGPADPRRPDAPGQLASLAGKAAQPAFRSTVRTAWLAADPERAREAHAALAGALGQFAVVGCNALIPRREHPRRTWAAIHAGTVGRRERVVLAADEVATLVHSPGDDVVVPHLLRTRSRRRELPHPMPPGILHLADHTHRDGAAPVGVTVGQLMSHAYVVGPSGTGKTTLLTALVLSLAATGTAGVVLDPHGDLVRQTLARIPDHLLERLTILDLSDPSHLPSINPLWLPPDPPGGRPVARAVRSAAVTAVFADLWGLHRSATPNLLHFLEAALAALVACGHGTLADVPRFLTDGGFRAGIVREAADPRISARWAEFAGLSHDDRSRTVRAILNKAADFDRNPVLGTVFGDPGPGVRIDELMDSGRLLLVSLPRGLVPEGTVELIGSLVVSLTYQSALAREARAEDDRPPVVAVIDEFQEFALSTFAKALTATRKYGLGLVVANQNLSRVRSISADLLETLLANAGTVVSFRTAPADAAVLAPLLAPFGVEDLTGLGPYECYWRVPGPRGPDVVSARTRELPAPVRDAAEVAAVAARLRLPGRPLAAGAAGRADADWTARR